MEIHIHADASPAIGTGHVMRCLALALWARKRGWGVRMSGHVSVDWLRSRMLAEGLPFLFLDEDQARTHPKDFPRRCALSSDEAWLVLDGYHFSLACQQAVRDAGHKLLVIDDYAHLPEYSCDILLNQNIGAAKLNYQGSIGTRLLEPGYALLRPEFALARRHAEQRRFTKKARHILISTGGGDASRFWTEQSVVFSHPALAACVVRVIAGATPARHIQHCLRRCPATVEVLEYAGDMPALLHWADLCVSAAGSTCWELCCMGVPSLLLSLADNQENIVREFVERGLSPAFSGDSLIALLEDPVLRQTCSGRLRNLVSGQGASRVLDSMEAPRVTLQAAAAKDCLELWSLINTPDLRQYAASTESVSLEDHRRWFTMRLHDPLPFLIARDARETLCGFIRFGRSENQTFTVSIALSQALRGKGTGRYMLRQALAMLHRMEPDAMVEALIRADNAASQAFFSKMGFKKRDDCTRDSVLVRFHRSPQPREDAP